MSHIQTLQVFNSGKPCGWLGHTAAGYWFHYASNNPGQHWISLLMPPNQNFFQQQELFPVFAQHLPISSSNEANLDSPLNFLHHFNGKQLGLLSFTNPDSPVVRQPPRTPQQITHGQSVLIARQARKTIADTLVHHEGVWPTVKTLLSIKRKIDGNNRLNALRWTPDAECANGFVFQPRPDVDRYQQQLLGFEPVSSVFNLSNHQYWALTQDSYKLKLAMTELARTYCKNASAEIALIQQLLPMLSEGKIHAFVVYRQSNQHAQLQRPTILGLEYLPVM